MSEGGLCSGLEQIRGISVILRVFGSALDLSASALSGRESPTNVCHHRGHFDSSGISTFRSEGTTKPGPPPLHRMQCGLSL